MLLIAGGAALAEAQTYRPGDRVVVVRDGKLRVGKNNVDDVWPGLTLQVGDVKDNYLWLSNGKPGWLDRSHVIPLDRRAIDRLTEMIRDNPRKANLYNGRSSVWEALDELDIAISDLNEAIRLSPSAAGYNNRGNKWYVNMEYGEAIADYNEALRLDPKYVIAYVNRGGLWHLKGDYVKALGDYDEARRLDPRFVGPCCNKAFLLATANDEAFRNAAKALTLADAALAIDPKDAYAMTAKACANALAGDFEQAIAWQNRALEDADYTADTAIDGGAHAPQRIERWQAKKLWLDSMAK